ncbi:2-C-methyl-D-erythritol 2,4-cyclodiphosphate synthase [Iocasia frigidifontis]|uniref:2-C-methyl-D-erythritol 2,4-cyclodiphosphate synthase n=1 Tax=Iocasia fonsfrigidae TaxID=2682810 RepID=A0A8A7KMM8_9FIRM|nr:MULTISPECIES: 2-C-methyl-D-erythritol 2,4-cyclodiphosphate synthase [Halanaerobiaceae]AZO96570.1 2-C-methyl-D-erythritol 2,4-cyclodiphosphate synthase [Halocella sp. SP3-1]QTL99324.1 2-C-methyl-D-erythritol 2,4-cyclodiphosphate synthase [Iocasia fonsfrigidae]
MRVGLGFDVHGFKKDRPLIIAGIHIPYQYGLMGHSDADVLTHALMDAILGAMAKGDIGRHFPDSNQRYKNINSLLLLDEVYKLLMEEEYRIENIDLVLMAEKPKISPYYNKIISKYAEVLQINKKRINMKATTTEGLGFVGREEGMAAQAVVLIESNERG